MLERRVGVRCELSAHGRSGVQPTFVLRLTNGVAFASVVVLASVGTFGKIACAWDDLQRLLLLVSIHCAVSGVVRAWSHIASLIDGRGINFDRDGQRASKR